MSDRFTRQRGLVRQDIVEHLVVSMSVVNAPSRFLDAMNTLGQQMGAPAIVNSDDSVPREAFHIEWSSNAKQPMNTTCLHVSYGNDGVFLDGTVAKSPFDPVYEPALATVAACLVWSELLRRSDAFLPIEIPKVSVSVNVRVNENALRHYVPTLNFSLEGHSVHQNVRESNDGTSHKRVLLRLDDDDPLVRDLIQRLNVNLPGHELDPQTPTLPVELPKLQPTLSGHVTVVGAGGLGSWCLHTLVEGLRLAADAEVKFLVFDKDLNIESHNLNRQVIYEPEDIGSTKIAATRRWLGRRLPGALVETVYELTDAMAHPAEEASTDGVNLDDLLGSPAEDAPVEDSTLSIQQTIERLESTDLIIGCLDAMRPRVLANCIAAKLGVPYINGGVAALGCAYHQLTESSLIDLYGPTVARDTTVMSCQEDGAVPLSSIVLTNAFVGSFQALSALQRLSGAPSSSIQSARWDAYTNDIHVVQTEMPSVQCASIKALNQALWPEEATA